MDRRSFIKNCSMLGTASILNSIPGLSFASSALQQASYAEQFDKALLSHKRLRGWQGVDSDIAEHNVPWQGTLPEQLVGKNLFRNGPGRQSLGGERYSHWFDGDGLINKYALNGSGISHSGKFVRTKKFLQESQAGKFLYNGAGSTVLNPQAVKGPETVNTANIALLPIKNELWALWEAASPYRIAQDSLDTLGQVSFAQGLDGVPFSAHPHVDQQGNIWNFGDISYLGQQALIIYQLNKSGELQQYKVVATPRRSYLHDFAVTENHLIFFLPPLFPEKQAATLIDSFQWRPEQGSILLVVDKNNLEVVKQIEMEAGFVFHFGNSWQSKDELVLNACWYQDARIMTDAMGDVVGTLNKVKHQRSCANQIRINLTSNRVLMHKSPLNMEFPQFDQRHSTQQTAVQFGVTMNSNPNNREYDSISAYYANTGKLDSYSFGAGVVVEEPIFVAKDNGSEGQGYLINTSLDYARGHTQVTVFDARHISDGPLALAKLPYYMPLGFHGTVC
jgi:all-trans-8'-apo-beta-carotenal 15,15'-oxygenase